MFCQLERRFFELCSIIFFARFGVFTYVLGFYLEQNP